MSEPLSNYPRDPGPVRSPDLSRGERYAGCGCILLPATLMTLAMTFGLMLGEGPQPDGSIGQEPGRGGKVLVALLLALACLTFGTRLLGGKPKGRRAATCLLAGTIALVAGAHLTFLVQNLTLGLPLTMIGLGLLAASFAPGKPSAGPPQHG